CGAAAAGTAPRTAAAAESRPTATVVLRSEPEDGARRRWDPTGSRAPSADGRETRQTVTPRWWGGQRPRRARTVTPRLRRRSQAGRGPYGDGGIPPNGGTPSRCRVMASWARCAGRTAGRQGRGGVSRVRRGRRT